MAVLVVVVVVEAVLEVCRTCLGSNVYTFLRNAMFRSKIANSRNQQTTEEGPGPGSGPRAMIQSWHLECHRLASSVAQNKFEIA